MTSPPGEYYNPALSPNGERIAFATTHRLYYKQIFEMSLDGSNLTRLTNLRGESSSPVFSPDGHKIAFVSGPVYTPRGFIGWIYVMNAGWVQRHPSPQFPRR